MAPLDQYLISDEGSIEGSIESAVIVQPWLLMADGTAAWAFPAATIKKADTAMGRFLAFTLNLGAGPTELRTAFACKDRQESGPYYVYVERLAV
jgi:hypothetical protein